jgi:hypothetical protein
MKSTDRLTRTAALSVLTVLMVASVPARAAILPIVGVKTDVEVTADLGGLGLTPAPFGSATANGAVFSFPVTGGTVDTLTTAALVEHDGSGVGLTAGAKSVFVGNFLIDTAAATVFGDGAVLGGAGFLGAPLFTFGTGTALPGVELLITDTLTGALTSVFGAPNLTGATFGYARPEISTVPIPAAGFLLLTGVGALGARALRKRYKARQS